jgi:hypothetical protein
VNYVRYHRDQAKRCLEMARLITDPLAANLLRLAAEDHFAQALEVEKQTGTQKPAHIPEKHPDDFSDRFYYRALRTGIGQALRSTPTEPASERLSKALDAVDRATGEEGAKISSDSTPDDPAGSINK